MIKKSFICKNENLTEEEFDGKDNIFWSGRVDYLLKVNLYLSDCYGTEVKKNKVITEKNNE